MFRDTVAIAIAVHMAVITTIGMAVFSYYFMAAKRLGIVHVTEDGNGYGHNTVGQ